jgi:signal transduction histidine kinase
VLAPFSEQDARHSGPVRRWFVRHPVVMDAIVAACFGVPALAAWSFAGDAALVDRGDTPVLVTLVVIGTATLFARRHAALVVTGIETVLAAVALALTGGLNGFDIAVALALYSVATTRPPRATWTTLLAASSVIGAAALVWAPAGTRFVEITGLCALVLIALSIGVAVRNRRLHVAALVDRGNALARETTQSAQLAAAEERARIAREMHDVVAHSLSVMIALADGAAAAIARSPDSAHEAIRQVSETGRAALTDMRRVLGVLRDDGDQLGPPPGSTDLDTLVEAYRRAGLAVQLVVAGPGLPADTGLQLAVYRIVQEALTNALRHTHGAGRVDVKVAHVPGSVVIDVTDTGGVAAAHGTVTAPSSGGGRGIIGMRERAAIYGGTVEAGPFGPGWRVRTALHCEEETT